MVYSGVVGRTQVYLGREELELLERVSQSTGATRSELIRRAIRSTFGEPSKDEKLRALRTSAGSWKERVKRGRSRMKLIDRVAVDISGEVRRSIEDLVVEEEADAWET